MTGGLTASRKARRWRPVAVALVVIAGAASGAVAQPAPAEPAQEQPGGEEPRRLGRKYPAPIPPELLEPREEPGVYVSVVSPRESGVHRHVGRRRMRQSVAPPHGLDTEVPAEELPSQSPTP